jgi:hypothetical protein
MASLLNRFRDEPWTWVIALIVGLLHAVVAERYDAFRNELYFIVCGRHLDFGFVDQSPLVPSIAAVTQLFGDNVWLLRLPAIIAAVALVLLTGAFSKLLGGNGTSSWMAGLAAGIAPGLVALTTTLGTSTFERGCLDGVRLFVGAGNHQRGPTGLVVGGSRRWRCPGGKVRDGDLDDCPWSGNSSYGRSTDFDLGHVLVCCLAWFDLRPQLALAEPSWMALSRCARAPTMFAVGAVVWSDLLPWLRNTWWIAAAAVSLVLAPIALPLLDPPALARYLEWTHLAPQPEEVAAIGAPLTQIFSDELGWRALEKQVAQVYRSLEPEERAHAAILTTNYGEAAALEVYGRQDGLPPVLCAQNQYFLWGDHGADEKVLIHVNGDPARWRRACQSVEVAGNFGAPYVMPYENNRPIFLCRGLPPDHSPKYGRG